MTALYVTSPEKGAGKTAIAAGLAKLLLSRGKKVGYLKPVTVTTGIAAIRDTDAQFMKQLLSLADPADILRPVVATGSHLSAAVREAYNKVSQGKDIVIIEGPSDLFPVARDIAAAVNAKIIVIESYSTDLLKAADSYKKLGAALAGVILNKVPKTRMEQAKASATKSGLDILGSVPEDRTLLATSVGEIAAAVKGKILNDASKSPELVENVMLGALGLDPGPDYFGRKTNKAAVLNSNRPDVALAALQTPLKCLVLAGDTKPNPMVLNDAAAKSVPVIIAAEGVQTLLPEIEDTLVKTRFNQLNKLPRLTELLEQQLNLSKLYQAIG